MHRIVLFLLISFFIYACGGGGKENKLLDHRIKGNTQGTTYHISFVDSSKHELQPQVDSILAVIDLSLSTYVDSSVISRFNQADSVGEIDEHVLNVFWKSNEIYHNTNGAFDPTVKPLLSFWGFGSEKINFMENIDSTIVDSILNFVGLEKISLYKKGEDSPIRYLGPKKFEKGTYFLVKDKPGIELDFNAIAQGYTVDVIANFLEDLGISNYMVEVGGELRTKGKNSKGNFWQIGIDKPKEDESEYKRDLQAIITLKDDAIATSGNYRKFYMKNGVKYSHTISPETGFPVRHTLLSATVLADDCMTSDGYATAFMVMGYSNAKSLLKNNKELEAYLIYSDDQGNWRSYMTEEVVELIKEQ